MTTIRLSHMAAKGGAAIALLLLAACAAPGASMSTKGELAFEVPSDLCNVIDPTPDMIRTLRARDDYADILIALGRSCPAQADLFGIGATGSVPSLTMVEEDGGRPPVFAQSEIGRIVDHPDPPAVDDTQNQVTDPPAEQPPT